VSVVTIESNTTSPVPGIAAASRFGHQGVVLTTDCGAYPDGYFAGCARVIGVDTEDVRAVEAAVHGLDEPAVAVYSSSDRGVEVAAEVAERLGFRTNSAEAIANACAKDRQERILRDAGVCTPDTLLVTDARQDVAAQLAGIAPPYVVKPRRGTGSIGVVRCDRAEAARASALSQLAEGAGGVLIQHLVSGAEISVEVFNGAPVAILAKHLGAEPAFVEVGHRLVIDAAGEGLLGAVAEAERAVAALQLGVGAMHVEIRLGAAGPVILEVNPRLAGGQIPAVVRHGLGVDLQVELLRDLLGGRARLDHTRRVDTAIRFALADRPGALVAVHGADAARAVAGVVEVSVSPRRRVVLGDFRQRIGSVIAVAGKDSGVNALNVATVAAAHLRADVR
jgi:S-sulfo-L-cysteine synthase (3-phospho-L-serine-dependent)